MAIADLLRGLFETTVATTGAVALVLLLRRPLRNTFGAAVAYAAWLVVPLAALAVLLPPPSIQMPARQVLQVVASPLADSTVAAGAAIAPAPWVLALWLLGALVTAAWFARQQHGFHRGLGRLQKRAEGLHVADAVDGLPAAMGLLRPVVVLPSDFDVRYDSEQCALLLAHERSHIVHGDLHANALATALRCVFWFNPLLHAAIRQFRHDQELACDLRVIAGHPQSRRAYGEAMFMTQLATQALPVGCQWGYSHPLKERIAMLSKPVPTRARWIIGTTLVFALSSLTAFGVWAAQPAAPAAQPPAPPAPPLPADAPTPPLPPPAPARLAQAESPAMPLPAPPSPPPPPPPLRDLADPRMPAPPYPPQALRQGVDGNVVLLIDVGADGKPTHVQVQQSQPAGVFDAAAVEAARRWTFEPKRMNGKAVASRVQVPVRFEARTSGPAQ